MEPPTPTQKPRPISSRLIASPSGSTSSSTSGSSNRPRKRRATAAQRARAQANQPDGDMSDPTNEKIDELLAQLAAAQVSPIPLSDSPLRSMNTNTSRSIVAPSPLRKTVSGTSDWSKTTVESSSQTNSIGSSRSRNPSTASLLQTSSDMSIRSDVRLAETTSKSLPRPDPARRIPMSPTKQGCPRIGLRSSQSVTSISRRPDPSKQFKPPLLNPPTRCSPRRHPPVQPPREQVQTPSRSKRVQRTDHGGMIPRLPPPKRGKEPSSDGPTTGDESFDSFDGMFEDGGEEVERLFSMVDGSL